MKILENRVMIKKLDGSTELESGLVQPDDPDNLPKAEIMIVADNVKGVVEVGDEVYYMESREKGRVIHDGEERFIVPIANIIAVI